MVRMLERASSFLCIIIYCTCVFFIVAVSNAALISAKSGWVMVDDFDVDELSSRDRPGSVLPVSGYQLEIRKISYEAVSFGYAS